MPLIKNKILCRLCKKNNTKQKFSFISPSNVPETFHVYKCNSCGHLFTFPIPSPPLLNSYYNSDSFYNHLLQDPNNEDIKNENKKRWALIKRFLQTGLLVDIGCGTGSFLSLGKEYDFETIGIEGSEKLADYGMNKLNLKIIKQSFESLNYTEQKPDIITLWDVMEHIFDAEAALKKIKDLLKPEGLLFIGVPNAASFDARILGANWIGWWIPLHLHHYSSKTLKNLLDNNGFEVIHEEFQHQPYIIHESCQILFDKDNSNMGAYSGKPNARDKITRKLVLKYPSLKNTIEKILIKQSSYFSRTSKFKYLSSYLITVAKLKK